MRAHDAARAGERADDVRACRPDGRRQCCEESGADTDEDQTRQMQVRHVERPGQLLAKRSVQPSSAAAVPTPPSRAGDAGHEAEDQGVGEHDPA